MRNSPRRHVLVLIREELGKSQKELASILCLSQSATQKIELKKLPLSPDTARRASERLGVSIEDLIENNVSSPLRAVNGKRWTKKACDEWRASLSDWAKLSPEEHAWRLRNSELLLRAYLEHRTLVESFENPEIGAELLDSHLQKALLEFRGKNLKLLKKDWREQFVSKLDNDDCGLESVLWDVQEVLKAAKELPPRSRAIRNKKPLPPMPDPIGRARSEVHALVGEKWRRMIKDAKSSKKQKRPPL
jgi:transcriptional regulator with XRE-family HTH domain